MLAWALEYFYGNDLRVIHLDEDGHYMEEISPEESFDFEVFPKNQMRICKVLVDTVLENGMNMTKYQGIGYLGLDTQDDVIEALETETDWPDFLEYIQDQLAEQAAPQGEDKLGTPKGDQD